MTASQQIFFVWESLRTHGYLGLPRLGTAPWFSRFSTIFSI
jgi:hypothetical protein